MRLNLKFIDIEDLFASKSQQNMLKKERPFIKNTQKMKRKSLCPVQNQSMNQNLPGKEDRNQLDKPQTFVKQSSAPNSLSRLNSIPSVTKRHHLQSHISKIDRNIDGQRPSKSQPQHIWCHMSTVIQTSFSNSIRPCTTLKVMNSSRRRRLRELQLKRPRLRGKGYLNLKNEGRNLKDLKGRRV